MKNKILPVIAAVILIAAFGVALYPTVSQGINQLMSESAITQYNDTVDTLSAAEKTRQLAARYPLRKRQGSSPQRRNTTTVCRSALPTAFQLRRS